jgi:hypothetical protein
MHLGWSLRYFALYMLLLYLSCRDSAPARMLDSIWDCHLMTVYFLLHRPIPKRLVLFSSSSSNVATPTHSLSSNIMRVTSHSPRQNPRSKNPTIMTRTQHNSRLPIHSLIPKFLSQDGI